MATFNSENYDSLTEFQLHNFTHSSYRKGNVRIYEKASCDPDHAPLVIFIIALMLLARVSLWMAVNLRGLSFQKQRCHRQQLCPVCPCDLGPQLVT